MAVILSAAGALDWFRQRFAPDLSYECIEERVSSSPIGSNGALFLPYLNGERTPHRDPDARGVLFGMSSFNSQGDILRAVHEGVIFALREGAESIAGMGTPMTNVRVVVGGSRSRVWCQMLADNLGTPIWSPLVDEGATWQRLNSGLPDLDVRRIVVAGGRVFALTAHRVVRLQTQ